MRRGSVDLAVSSLVGGSTEAASCRLHPSRHFSLSSLSSPGIQQQLSLPPFHSVPFPKDASPFSEPPAPVSLSRLSCLISSVHFREDTDLQTHETSLDFVARRLFAFSPSELVSLFVHFVTDKNANGAQLILWQADRFVGQLSASELNVFLSAAERSAVREHDPSQVDIFLLAAPHVMERAGRDEFRLREACEVARSFGRVRVRHAGVFRALSGTVMRLATERLETRGRFHEHLVMKLLVASAQLHLRLPSLQSSLLSLMETLIRKYSPEVDAENKPGQDHQDTNTPHVSLVFLSFLSQFCTKMRYEDQTIMRLVLEKCLDFPRLAKLEHKQSSVQVALGHLMTPLLFDPLTHRDLKDPLLALVIDFIGQNEYGAQGDTLSPQKEKRVERITSTPLHVLEEKEGSLVGGEQQEESRQQIAHPKQWQWMSDHLALQVQVAELAIRLERPLVFARLSAEGKRLLREIHSQEPVTRMELPALSSKQHFQLCDALRDLGASFSTEMQIGPYSIDVRLEDSRVLVEVDGPLHFVTEGDGEEQGEEEGREGGDACEETQTFTEEQGGTEAAEFSTKRKRKDEPASSLDSHSERAEIRPHEYHVKSILKHRLLTKLGWRVHHIAYDDWPALRHNRQKVTRRLIFGGEPAPFSISLYVHRWRDIVEGEGKKD
uniref:RAP domain-containing protein n=1 Tax=Chromera velia CCMP2878 TaxID=1169474 RepID=A0A0G4IFE9_9ALVE|eukprot:Cvel_13956.t1-p1 / transcript=Cvel_13956.t1 / gene=Cvel_13956 / organism=Chromera_velia_CCMP2878 / gene_product=hypothetical protein / transcript_product=hypothetical protein / location=Cvel_scaffold974:42759-49192(+) / protein_length=663 / sequence_SO=supercontig / SO=protein_coding / is_pseudo=false